MILLDAAKIDCLNNSEELVSLSNEGIFFPQMITASPYTFASVHSIFTGMYGSKNGVNGYSNMFKLKKNCKTLTEYFKENGYKTICDIESKAVINPRGFDKVLIQEKDENDLYNRHRTIIDENISKDGKPLFMFFQYSGIHRAILKSVLNV